MRGGFPQVGGGVDDEAHRLHRSGDQDPLDPFVVHDQKALSRGGLGRSGLRRNGLGIHGAISDHAASGGAARITWHQEMMNKA